MILVKRTLCLLTLVLTTTAKTDHELMEDLVATTTLLQKNVEGLTRQLAAQHPKIHTSSYDTQPISSNANQFTFVIKNSLKPPYFKESVNLAIVFENQPLISYMDEAIMAYPTSFKSYNGRFSDPYGFFVTAINGISESYLADGAYWGLWNQNGGLGKGVSQYIPQPGEQILFNLTRDASRYVSLFY